MKTWSTREEIAIQCFAGKIPVSVLAAKMGRTEQSVRSHAHVMRLAGRLDRDLRPEREEVCYTPKTSKCPQCCEMRTKFDHSGICRVCWGRESLERHKELMMREWANLPKELQNRTKESFEITRTPSLMKVDLVYPKAPLPRREGDFWLQEASDRHAMDVEAYELRRIHLDIDACKQRRSKWKRKTRKYLQQQEAANGR